MKNVQAPYFLDKFLPEAVKKYMETVISVDIDVMTHYLMDTYIQFSGKSFKTFKVSVKKAYEYVENQLNASRPAKKTKNKAASTVVNGSAIVSSTSTPKTKCQGARRRTVELAAARGGDGVNTLDDDCHIAAAAGDRLDCFIVDVDGDSQGPPAQDDDTVDNAQVSCKPPAQKNAPYETSATASALAKKRRLDPSKDIEDSILKAKKKRKDYEWLCTPVVEEITFAELGGLDSVEKEMLAVTAKFDSPRRRPVTVLLSGPRGVGKTALAVALAQVLQLTVVRLPMANLVSSTSLVPEKKFNDEICDALDAAPVFILLTQVEKLCKEGGGRQPEERVLQALMVVLANLRKKTGGERMVVAVECSQLELMDQEFLNYFSVHIALRPPTASQRTEMLQRICSRHSLCSSVQLQQLGLRCSGYLAGDLVRLVTEADEIAELRSLVPDTLSMADRIAGGSSVFAFVKEILITDKDFAQAAKCVQPLLKKDGFPSIPDTTWRDVGGLYHIREELRKKMLDPIRDPDIKAKYNINCSGILLWGPPGCGKTLLAKAVANEAGINLLIVNGPELLSMYQGESERSVRVVFARAAAVAPCVIFFDEFDSLCPRRSKTGSESGSKSTIVNTLLTEMSGFLSRGDIYVMAATNLPSVLDPAVLRPGRFDTLLYVGLPDTASRVAVLNAATKHGTLPKLALDVDLENIARRCEHFSGADCRNLVDTAAVEANEERQAWRRSLDATSDDGPVDRKEHHEPVETGATVVESDGSWEDMDGVEGCVEIGAAVLGDHNEDKGTSVSSSNCSRATVAGAVDPDISSPFAEGEYLVYARHFDTAFEKVSPSVSVKERLKFEEQKDKAFLGR